MTVDDKNRFIAQHVMGWEQGQQFASHEFLPSTNLNHCHMAEMELKQDLQRWARYGEQLLNVVRQRVPFQGYLIEDSDAAEIAALDAKTRVDAMIRVLRGTP